MGTYRRDPAPRRVAEDAKPMQGGGQGSCQALTSCHVQVVWDRRLPISSKMGAEIWNLQEAGIPLRTEREERKCFFFLLSLVATQLKK